MIALRKLGPGEIGLAEVEPRAPGAGEVRLDVIAAGVCGTDLHIADDEFPSHPPVTMGHEVTGVVAEAGEGVDRSWVGRRVACETYFSVCRRCEHCRQGRENLCEQRQSIGSAMDGGFAPSLTIPARNLWPVPDHVGVHAGALLEPLACVTQCLSDPNVIEAGDRVLVVGPGTMGLLTAMVARAAGARATVLGLPRDRDRLVRAAELGFGVVIAPRNDFEVVCEASGTAGGAATCLAAAARGGRYVQVGIFGKPVEIDVDQVLYKELTMTSGSASTWRSWQRAARLVAADRVQLDPLVTDAVPLAEWERAFAQVRAGDGVKTVLVPA